MEALWPNLIYLVLVGGVLLTVMAVFSPGTGLLELAAFSALAAAGWGIYHLSESLNLWALIILALGVLPFLLAVRKSRNIIFLVIAIAAFVIGSVFLFSTANWWQPAINPLLAVVVSILGSGYLWIATTKVLEADQRRPLHDLGELIGALGEAKTYILAEGSVQVGGELWSATSQTPIAQGTQIKVIKRDGFILEVQPLSKESKS